jgi:DNA-binding NtrC family response regulator
MIESQLAGHESGLFTGAQQKHKGFFEQADHGTLFPDEIIGDQQRTASEVAVGA